MDQNKHKVIPGTQLEPNSKVTKEERTHENQFKKLNFTQMTKDTLKIKRREKVPMSERPTSQQTSLLA